MRLTEVADGIGRNTLALTGATVITEQFSIRAAAINDVGIGRIGRNVAALTRAGRMPIAKSDSAIIAAAENKDAAAILLRAINVVREIIVHGHVVELRGRLVVPTAPCVARVHADACTLITAKNHSLRIAWVDPHGVIIIAAGRAFDGDKRFSGIGGAVD